MPKYLVLFYVDFQTIPLYIRWDQFITVQFNLPTPSNQVPSNCFGLQSVTSKPLEHCDFFEHQGSSWRLPYQTENNLDYLQIEIFKFNPQRDKNIFSQLSVYFQNKISLSLLISVFVVSLLP